MPQPMPLPAALCDELYTGLGDCHDTVVLLAAYALSEGGRSAEMGGMFAALNLLKYRLSALSLLVDPGVLANAQEVNHAQQ